MSARGNALRKAMRRAVGLGPQARWRREQGAPGCGNEGATVHHSITSSARSSSDCGIVRPSALAVFRLITR